MTDHVIVLKPVDESAKVARDFVVKLCETWAVGDNEELHEDLRLVASEMVTNAVKHGSTGDDHVIVRAYLNARGPVIEVWDASPAMPVMRPESHTGESGRGLHLLTALTIRWGACLCDDGGKVVRAEFAL